MKILDNIRIKKDRRVIVKERGELLIKKVKRLIRIKIQRIIGVIICGNVEKKIYHILMIGAEIIAIISVGGTLLATLITTFFTSMSLSRCKNINCCWSCFVCDREPLTEESAEKIIELQNREH
tara:strand:- start:566 stop:934 length:369 start_codon:yes stop_codon:yes gene_type:complete